jgi:hypothetical protein
MRYVEGSEAERSKGQEMPRLPQMCGGAMIAASTRGCHHRLEVDWKKGLTVEE